MRIINSGCEYDLYDDSVKTFDKLPPKTYVVSFQKMRGFFLEERANIEISEKAYGIHDEKAEKVMNTFKSFKRSLGVILSGDKGIGKTMFAKKLCEKAIENGMPVILIEERIPHLVRFLERIEQECIFLFDEFEKVFPTKRNNYNDYDDEDDEREDEQAKFLSLFDGTAGGKKLFVLTCNDLERMNDCFINRPGRFHYHFRFDYPSQSEMEEYLTDKLEEKYHGAIPSVVRFSKRVRLNYDCLRAIALEINMGVSFGEAISDLNIINLGREEYDVKLVFENGKKLCHDNYRIDIIGDDRKFSWVTFENNSCKDIVDVRFNNEQMIFDEEKNAFIIEKGGFELDFDDYDADDSEISMYMKMKPAYISFSQSKKKKLHYFV